MTADVSQERIRKVLAGVLDPLVRTLIRCGVSYTEFSDLAKCAFVQAASSDYGVRNRPTNIARVALMTGLSRKEVSRIRNLGVRSRKKSQTNVTMPAIVLNAWHTDSRFLDRTGLPKVLAFSGGTCSFCSLVRAVSSDIPPGAMRQELLRAGAIRRVDRTRLVPIKRYFVPDAVDERVIVGLELGLRRLAETIAFNSSQKNNQMPRFQRFVESPIMPERDLPEVRLKLQEMLAAFSLEVDDYLSSSVLRRNSLRGSKRIRGVRAGIGLYYFDELKE